MSTKDFRLTSTSYFLRDFPQLEVGGGRLKSGNVVKTKTKRSSPIFITLFSSFLQITGSETEETL